jgi:hypothetical protein
MHISVGNEINLDDEDEEDEDSKSSTSVRLT